MGSHRILNIGSSVNVKLLNFIEILENELGIKAIKDLKPMQLGDVMNTSADCELIKNITGDINYTSIEIELKNLLNGIKIIIIIK